MADLSTHSIERALGRLTQLGYASEPVIIDFLDARGRRAGTTEPERLQSSVRRAILARATRRNCYYAFAISLMDGYHSVLLLVDTNYPRPKIEWFDQFSPKPEDEVTLTLDDRITTATRSYWRHVKQIKNVGYKTPVRVWALRKRVGS